MGQAQHSLLLAGCGKCTLARKQEAVVVQGAVFSATDGGDSSDEVDPDFGSEAWRDVDELEGLTSVRRVGKKRAPPLEVPAQLASILAPGAALGPPRPSDSAGGIGGGAAAAAAAGDASLVQSGQGARAEECSLGLAGAEAATASTSSSAAAPAPGEVARAALRGLACGCSAGTPGGNVKRALSCFTTALKAGVSLSLVLDSVGVLLVEARLNLSAAEPSLDLYFNEVQRRLILQSVEKVVVERAQKDSSSGAWLVRIILGGSPVWTFLFDGTLDGQQEAHYFGGCLRMLVEDLSDEILGVDTPELRGFSNLDGLKIEGRKVAMLV